MLFNLFKKNVTIIFIYKYILHMLFPFYHLIKNPSVFFPLAIFVSKVDSFPLPVKTVINLPFDCFSGFFSTCSYFLINIWNTSLAFVDSQKTDVMDKCN